MALLIAHQYSISLLTSPSFSKIYIPAKIKFSPSKVVKPSTSFQYIVPTYYANRKFSNFQNSKSLQNETQKKKQIQQYPRLLISPQIPKSLFNRPLPISVVFSKYLSTELKKSNELAPKKWSWAWAKKSAIDGLKHTWHGFKLFAFEIKICVGILRRVLNGATLTRKERKQLQKTFADMLRMIPFMFFVIVPFAEFLLPVCLWLFPNMLPSTFEDSMKKEEAALKRLKMRMNLAKFLRDVSQEVASKKLSTFDKEFGVDLLKVQEKLGKGIPLEKGEILSFSKLLKEDFTLDNLSRSNLVVMCKYMDISTFGTDSMLRGQLEKKLRQLRNDDEMIQKEGVEVLDHEELKAALRARGMRISDSDLTMRKNLLDWLELSLQHQLPASLLILSRSFVLTPDDTDENALTAAISSLPEEVLENVELKIAERAGTASSEQKLEMLKAEDESIKEELEEKKEEEESKKLPQQSNENAQVKLDEKFATDKKEEIEPEDLQEVAEVASVLSAKPREHTELEELKTSLEESKKKDSEEKELEKEQVKSEIEKEAGKKEEKRKDAMDQYLSDLVSGLEEEVEKVEKLIGTNVHKLDLDGDGVISVEELEKGLELLRNKELAKRAKEIASTLDKDKDGKISLQELVRLTSKEFEEFTNPNQEVEKK